MNDTTPNPFYHWVNLEQPRLGSEVVDVSDDFFGAVERMLQPGEPVFIPDKYDEHGKWMDGWESRRRRTPGHDLCIVRLGVPGVLRGVDIDTRFFTGNYAPEASLEGCCCDESVPGPGTQWVTLLERTSLRGDSHNYLQLADAGSVSHVRLHIYPDGGVARLRLYGEIRPDWARCEVGERLDLAALVNGGRALACSDEHYGSMHNLNAPGRGVNMGDGWETARRRGPGHDWVILALGTAGIVEAVEVDTAHFKGNYPDRVSIEGLYLPQAPDDPAVIAAIGDGWRMLLPESKLEADRRHLFARDVVECGPCTHLRMNIFPDGGVSRLRAYGTQVSTAQS